MELLRASSSCCSCSDQCKSRSHPQHCASLSTSSPSSISRVLLTAQASSLSLLPGSLRALKPGIDHRSLYSVSSPLAKCRRPRVSTIKATARPVNSEDESVATHQYATISLSDWVHAFYRFTRPHTVIGTAIGIISISLLAVQNAGDFSSRFVVGVMQALIPALFMNVYIVGLNQIYDIQIDKVNKPYLPLASGEFTLNTGIAIVSAFAAMSLAMGFFIGSRPLLWALTVSFVLGTAYSIDLPLLRWKRSAFAAATCILCVRALVVQLAFYLHMQSFVFRRLPVLTKPLIFATGFMCFFSVVIALFKDIPDIEGDRVFGIQSYTVRLGQERVFWLCVYLLMAAYGVAFVAGLTCELLWSRIIMAFGHAALAGILWQRAKGVDLKSKAAITASYMFVWKLFYAEYLLIPFMR